MTDQRIEIGELWRQVNRGMHDRFRHAFRGNEMQMGTLMMLRQINLEPGLTVSDLARRVGTVKSHVSKTVEQLVGQGLVEKRQDPADQRLIRLYVTQVALGAKAEMEERARAAWAEVVAEVSDAELMEVEQGLRILLGALAKANQKGNIVNE